MQMGGGTTLGERDHITRIAEFFGASFAVISIILIIIIYAWDGRPHSLELGFNPYALLSAFSFIANAIGFIMLTRVKVRTDVLQWFSISQFSIAAWAAGEIMIRLSATPEAATFWSPVTTLGSVAMPISLFMFAVSYTGSNIAKQPFVAPTLLGASALYLYIDSHTDIFTYYNPASATLTPWGYVCRTNTSGYILISLWLVLLATAALVILYRFRKQSIDPILRQQTKLFIIATAIPLVGGAITDGLLPALNITIVPPMTVVLMGIMGIIITYGILRYRFFSFTPGLIANQILGTMNEAVIGLLPDFRVRYVNTGTEQLLGMPSVEFGDKSLSDFLAKGQSTVELSQNFDRLLAETDYGTFDAVDLKRADGTGITVKMAVTKLMDKTQQYGYLVVLTDITAIARQSELVERQVVRRTRELHEEQARLRAAIEGIALGFILFDSKDRIIIQNQPLSTIFGQNESIESLDELDSRLTGFNLREHCDKVLKTGHPFKTDDVALGSKILRIFIGPVRVGDDASTNVIGVMLMVEDITEERVLARSKDEFFSIASHELRTPLTAIKGNTSMMIDYFKPIIDQDSSFKQMVLDIYASSARLIDIVNDFLSVSRIEQGKMVFRFEVFSIDKVIESIFYEMRASLIGKELDLKTNVKTLGSIPQVWADRDRVTQILYNLVGNAIKFTDKGSVTVDASVDGKYIHIEVVDTGKGVPVHNQKLLFRKFQQAGDSILTRDTTRGTGLGLYISKLMAQSMGCVLALEQSVEGKGSTFYLKVPIATKAQLHSSENTGDVNRARIDVSTGLSLEK